MKGFARRAALVGTPVAIGLAAMVAWGADKPPANPPPPKPDFSGKFFKSEEAVTQGSAAGVSYQATAGTLVVHPRDWNDSAQNGGTKNPDAKRDEITRTVNSRGLIPRAARALGLPSKPVVGFGGAKTRASTNMPSARKPAAVRKMYISPGWARTRRW
ncbi:MAG TPA: hypothetical protein VGF97_12410 [Rhizomicrobium sp.]